jgi:hypothetical protein
MPQTTHRVGTSRWAGSLTGIELAWRLYMAYSGRTATQPTTWSNIKSMYE